jgi:hypothetical protein
MATVGELTVALRAELSGLQQGMERAHRGIRGRR